MCLLKVTSGLSPEALCAEGDACDGAWADTSPAMVQAKGTTAAIRRRCRFIAGGYAQRPGSSIKGVGSIFPGDQGVLGLNESRGLDENTGLMCFTDALETPFGK